MSRAARSPWATRSAPRERGSPAPCCMALSAQAGGWGWWRCALGGDRASPPSWSGSTDMPPADAAILLIADGARPDVLRELLDARALPNLQEHVVARGCFLDAATTFTSTSGPGYVPFLTGNFAGTADIP